MKAGKFVKGRWVEEKVVLNSPICVFYKDDIGRLEKQHRVGIRVHNDRDHLYVAVWDSSRKRHFSTSLLIFGTVFGTELEYIERCVNEFIVETRGYEIW